MSGRPIKRTLRETSKHGRIDLRPYDSHDQQGRIY